MKLDPQKQEASRHRVGLTLIVRRRPPSKLQADLPRRILHVDAMQTPLCRHDVGRTGLGEDNLCHVCADGWKPINMVLVEIRRGRPPDQGLVLGLGIVDICCVVFCIPKRTVLVESTVRSADEILRDGKWTSDWTALKPPGKSRLRSHILRKACLQGGYRTGDKDIAKVFVLAFEGSGFVAEGEIFVNGGFAKEQGTARPAR